MSGSWLDLPIGTPFGVDNLPYGVFSTPGEDLHVVVALRD